MNFTHKIILFSIYFKPFIHFLGNKHLMEKGKEKLTHFFTVPLARPRNRPGPAPLHARCPHPGHNLRLGRKSARSTDAVCSDPTAIRTRRQIKTATSAPPLKP